MNYIAGWLTDAAERTSRTSVGRDFGDHDRNRPRCIFVTVQSRLLLHRLFVFWRVSRLGLGLLAPSLVLARRALRRESLARLVSKRAGGRSSEILRLCRTGDGKEKHDDSNRVFTPKATSNCATATPKRGALPSCPPSWHDGEAVNEDSEDEEEIGSSSDNRISDRIPIANSRMCNAPTEASISPDDFVQARHSAGNKFGGPGVDQLLVIMLHGRGER